jgi:hypothetical protein
MKIREVKLSEVHRSAAVIVCRHVFDDMKVTGPQVVAVYQAGDFALCTSCFQNTNQDAQRIYLFEDDDDHGESYELVAHEDLEIADVYKRGMTLHEYDAAGS